MKKVLLKIKTWEEMIKISKSGLVITVFSTPTQNKIDIGPGFTERMEEKLPANRLITAEAKSNGRFSWNRWIITEDMIEKVIEIDNIVKVDGVEYTDKSIGSLPLPNFIKGLRAMEKKTLELQEQLCIYKMLLTGDML